MSRRDIGRGPRAFALGVVLAGMMVAGCGRDGPDRTVVSGAVRYRGQPVKEGEIRFYPLPGTETPMALALIRDGQYVADGLGGVPVGKHKVEITAYSGGKASEDIEKQSVGKQYIPAKFNTATTLEITVASGGPITQDYDLKD